ncbi:MAG TPA: hypothetical protein VN380_05985 [Thermoanaerobaculia bacterium]|jgi:hypothetical protein|nr:hypothetical protein [Thermoanaerobaculia bacterium]
MDDDLKQVLHAIREENAAAHAETRRRAETAQAETLAKFEAAQVENAAAHAETRQMFETAQLKNEAAHAETRRQMGVLAEAQQYKLDLVIERVLSNGEKIDQLDAKFSQITSDLDTRVTRLEVASSRRRRI